MISKETLTNVARLNNLKPWQQEKHYIQALILNSISEEPLVFKGGTYLWFFHNLKRFSEDLDFTSNNTLPNNIYSRISKDLELFGIENKTKIITTNETTTSFRISAKGPLNTSEADLCHIYVEISKREKIINKTIPLKLNFTAYELPIRIINGMDLNEVGAEKIRATITRNKARDIYDLWHLINTTKITFNENIINEKLKYYNKKYSKELFIESINKKELFFTKELKSIVLNELPSFNNCTSTILNWINR